jgi:tetratricopeptide (TPR) repeat protein
MALVGAAVEQGRLDDAWTLTERASAFAPGSGRPWRGLGRLLLWAGRPAEALEAYRRAGFRSNPLNQVATMGAARALRDLGRDEEADVLVDELNRHSRSTDPWPALESAWRELPPPRTDDVGVGWDSYGAVRGFHDPLGGEGGEPAHRWSRGRAWLRLSPKTAAASYQLVLEMGSPEPSPHPRPEVHVYVNGALRAELRLERELRPYRVEAPAPPRGAPLLVELRCSTWTAVGYPADRGVRVDRLRVRPSSPGPGPEMPAEPPGKIG